MQVCTSLQTDNHARTPPSVFYSPDALPAAQPTASKLWRHCQTLYNFEKQPAIVLSRNMNFRQPLHKELLKVTIVCVDTFVCFWYWSITVLSQHPAHVSTKTWCQLAWMLCKLCCFIAFGTQTYQIILWIHRSHSTKFSIAKKSSFCLWELVQLQLRILKTTYW